MFPGPVGHERVAPVLGEGCAPGSTLRANPPLAGGFKNVRLTLRLALAARERMPGAACLVRSERFELAFIPRCFAKRAHCHPRSLAPSVVTGPNCGPSTGGPKGRSPSAQANGPGNGNINAMRPEGPRYVLRRP